MALANYTDLKSAVASFLHRSDLTTIIPDFITLVEASLNRELRTLSMETRATTSTSERYITLPSDFQELRNVKVQSTCYIQLDNLSPESLDTYYNSAVSGIPTAYAIVANLIYIAPQPNGTYTYEINYYAKIPDLATNSTNWLLTAHPDVYLYGALLQAAPYLHDDERIRTWGAMYKAALDSILLADRRTRWSGNAMQIKTDNPIV